MHPAHSLDDFWKRTLRLAIPVSVQNILISSFALVDTMMLGSLGDEPLAAVGMAGQWAWLFYLILFGFNSGAGVFIAQYWGVRDIRSIRKSLGLAALSALSVSLVFTLTAFFAPGFVLSFFTQDPAVAELGAVYLRWACWSYSAVCLNNLMCTLLRSTEEVRLPLYASMVSVSMNVALNALFIYGLKMGVRGAALATSISAWVSPLSLFTLSMIRKNILRAPIREYVGWTGAFVRNYFAVSLPTLVNETTWGLGTVVYKAIYANASTAFYAAFTISMSVSDIVFSFFVGVCHACAVIIGKHVGTGKTDEAYRDACRYTRMFPVFSAAVSVLFLLLRPLVLTPFTGSDAATLATASTLILFYLAEQPLRNIPYITIVGVFRAGGDTKIGMIYDFIGLWLLAIPTAWLGAMVFHADLPVVYLAMLLAEDGIKSFLCVRRLLSRKWIRPVTEQGKEALSAS
ncbi:MAG: MATE family efflux transporter [Clostridia bacterium]|nr:MATE family efflux transporter [Clostridia bacterium]